MTGFSYVKILPRGAYLVDIHAIYGYGLVGVDLIDVVCPPTNLALGVNQAVKLLVVVDRFYIYGVLQWLEGLELAALNIKPHNTLVTRNQHILRINLHQVVSRANRLGHDATNSNDGVAVCQSLSLYSRSTSYPKAYRLSRSACHTAP